MLFKEGGSTQMAVVPEYSLLFRDEGHIPKNHKVRDDADSVGTRDGT